ncbi:hypothetical protein GCM10022238_37950 [Gordonia hankookensis]
MVVAGSAAAAAIDVDAIELVALEPESLESESLQPAATPTIMTAPAHMARARAVKVLRMVVSFLVDARHHEPPN